MTSTKPLPVADLYLIEGWAAGQFIGSDVWLTVIGCKYESRCVFASREGAEERAAALRARGEWMADVTVRKVRRCSDVAFRVID